MKTRHWQDWAVLALGLWLILSPLILDFGLDGQPASVAVTVNFVLCGVGTILLAASALSVFRHWEEWLNAGLGLWLILSPVLLGFDASRPALWTALTAGFAIIGLSFWTLLATGGADHA